MRFIFASLLLSSIAAQAVTPEGKHKLVLIAGKPSHPPGMHEFKAGTMLLEKCLASVSNLVVDRHEMGWVKDEATFADADAVVIYADGGKGHPAVQGTHLETIQKLINKGVGFGVMHYGVEVVPELGGKEFQAWVGGHYENSFSCNPIWEPNFATFPEHQITRGVKPFRIDDEWYFNMRFLPAFKDGIVAAEDAGMKFVPILVATPPDATRDGPYVYPKGPYAHIQAEKGAAEAMMWSVERADGGRGFGFTGGHFHKNWGNADFRKTILNALLWVSKIEVPAAGVDSSVSEAELSQNLDVKAAPKPKKTAMSTPNVFQRGTASGAE
jgi:type 1 glutamine amidotransferase